jgi:hypothetical protein
MTQSLNSKWILLRTITLLILILCHSWSMPKKKKK